MRYTSFMFIEDGSVDVESLIDDLNAHNPEIKVIVYRRGSNPPALIGYEEGDDDKPTIGF